MALRDGRRHQRPITSLNVHAEPFVPATRMVGRRHQQPNTSLNVHAEPFVPATRMVRIHSNAYEVESVDKLLVDLYKLLLKEKEDDLFKALYSKRYRKEVWNIVERMMEESSDCVEESSDCVEESSDYVEKSYDDILMMKERMENELASRPRAPSYAFFSSINPISKIRKYISDLARSQKRLIELEKKYNEEAWYDSISYPMAPSSIIQMNAWQDCYPPLPDYKCEWDDRIREVLYLLPDYQYMDDINDANSPDVMSLLSLGSGTTLVGWTETGERRIELNSDTFRNKCVLVFCINVPVLYEVSFLLSFQSLINLCNELSLERAGKIEIVMVARMNILADTERAFNSLFSLFPTCLAVPYEDWDRRELIWKQLNCSVRRYQCFVYKTDGSLWTNFVFDSDTGPYGAEAFPFTKKDKKRVLKNRNKLRREGSLENLLRPHGSRSPVEVYEFNPPQQPQMRPISEVIKKKHVGLYVCTTGKLVPSLRDLYLQCKEKEEEFEIVVLYVPVMSGLDPRIFKEKIEREMQEQKVQGWWCLPFHNSVSLRFWGLTEDYNYSDFGSSSWFEDKLIIVGTNGKILDMYGARIYTTYGHIHPFTREAVVANKVEEVKKEKHLLDLLLGSTLFRGNNRSRTLSAEKLLCKNAKGLLRKNVIVFMGQPRVYFASGARYGFERLVTQYKSMKEKNVGFEVVFIEYCPKNPQQDEVYLDMLYSEMPWFVLRHDRTRPSPLAARLTELFRVQSLVGFGKDGRICSVKPLQQMYDEVEERWEELSLDDTLEKNLHRYYYFDRYRKI